MLDEIAHQQSDQLLKSASISDDASKIPLPGLRNLVQTKAEQIITVNRQALLSLEVSDQIGPLAVPEAVLVRLCGILLDNTIEAVQGQDFPRVQIAFLRHGQSYEFTIVNSLSQAVNFPQIFDSGYTTKATHSGLGLANVQEIVDENMDLSFESSIDDHQIQMTLFITGRA